MAVITNATFTGVADRLAKQVKVLQQAVTDASTGGTEHYDRIAADAVDNQDMIQDLNVAFNAFDVKIATPKEVIQPVVNDVINKIETHVKGKGMRDLDTFLQTSGIDVSSYFSDAYNYVKNRHLNAINVFHNVDTELGTLVLSDSGVGVWTEESAVGTGTGTYTTSNGCPENFEAYCVSGIGATDDIVVQARVLELSADQKSTSWTNVTFTIPKSTGAGSSVSFGSGKYLDLNTSASHFAGGQTSDAIIFRAKVLRNVGL